MKGQGAAQDTGLGEPAGFVHNLPLDVPRVSGTREQAREGLLPAQALEELHFLRTSIHSSQQGLDPGSLHSFPCADLVSSIILSVIQTRKLMPKGQVTTDQVPKAGANYS